MKRVASVLTMKISEMKRVTSPLTMEISTPTMEISALKFVRLDDTFALVDKLLFMFSVLLLRLT
jgi:hypothetical protein